MANHLVHPIQPRESHDRRDEAWTDAAHTTHTAVTSRADQAGRPADRAGDRTGDRMAGPDVILNPAVRVLWRGADVVQLELGARAVILDGIESDLVGALTGRAGRTRTVGATDEAASQHPAAIEAALPALETLGLAWRRPVATPTPPAVALAGELAALRARHGPRAERVLAARATSIVVVHGTGRLSVALGCVLAGANVGRINMHDSGEVHRHDSAPGGLQGSDEGRRFNEAAHDALRRAASNVDTRGLGPSERADLVVLAGEAPVTEELRAWLHERRLAHLSVRTGADDAVVGPLVLPGLTSCLGCADLARLDRDPAWSLLAAQLGTPRRHADPSDLALTTLTASLAALQILAFLDGDEPAALSGTLELALPDWRIRRRSWPPHPACDCGAAGTDGSDGSDGAAGTAEVTGIRTRRRG